MVKKEKPKKNKKQKKKKQNKTKQKQKKPLKGLLLYCTFITKIETVHSNVIPLLITLNFLIYKKKAK